ncbi:MAG: hypothetical protein E3J37_04430 [Anaerolineales bacterium]|nr:MAG: hypothetical protein E3J37_04430 [Anaerolineales bacterium]
MRGVQARVVLSLLMIAAGVLFLLQNLGFLEGASAILWTLAFAIAGGAFLYVYRSDRAHWWALIPGFTLLGIGGLIAVDNFVPQYADILGAPLLMGCISLSFWIIYLTNRESWWAIIPGGVLLTVGIFVGLESLIEGVELVGVFFLGLGLTFALLALLPMPEGRMRWSLIPADVLLIMWILFTAAAFSIFKLGGPTGVILVGLYLIYRTFRPKGQT